MVYISEVRSTAPENIENPTEKKVFKTLDKLKIPYECVTNDVVEAMEEWFGCNPGINTAHLKMKTSDLLNKFLPHIRHKAKIMDL